MKKAFLIGIMTTIVVFTANSQIVNIPDVNFKACLINDTAINTNLDNEIQLAEAQAFTGTISCINDNIVDLIGIEAFTNTTGLDVTGNLLSSLSLSNPGLTSLSVESNQLTSLDIFNCYNLEYLYLNGNQLTSIDLINNMSLKEIFINYNQLTSLDVYSPQLTFVEAISNQLLTFNASSPDLEYILVQDNQLSTLDVSNYLNLVTLQCDNNQLSSLLLHNGTNSTLEYVICNNNFLTSLDVYNEIALKELNCSNNLLSSLDLFELQSNLNLLKLDCNNNQLIALDVSTNSNLYQLYCNDNLLTSLNVANGNNTLFTHLFANNNSSLNCIEVDNETYSSTNWTGGNFQFDSQHYFSEDCSLAINEIDISQQVVVYPNPTKNHTTISIDYEANYMLVNIQGQILQQGKLINGDNSLDVSQHSSGMYFLNIITENGSKTLKLIKQ